MKKAKLISGLIGLTVFIGLSYFLNEKTRTIGIIPFIISFAVGLLTRHFAFKLLTK